MSGPLPDDDLERILTSLETMEASIKRLVKIREIDRAEYKANSDMQDIVERRFVKLTEASIDIGKVILRHASDEIPATNPGTMQALAEHDIIEDELAEAMAAAARFRNVLAHTYGPAIDQNVVYEALHDLDRYRQFLRSIRRHLASIDSM